MYKHTSTKFDCASPVFLSSCSTVLCTHGPMPVQDRASAYDRDGWQSMPFLVGDLFKKGANKCCKLYSSRKRIKKVKIYNMRIVNAGAKT